ncbi:MAG: DNA recombination/repair protein RecA [Chloroflexota bacterium]|nr:DNA recombination/repair protein RecA [Chloroflexota bacterium]
MQPDRDIPIARALASIQRRWGAASVQTAAQLPGYNAVVPTGFPELDTALHGGLPRGRIIEIRGQPTSGTRSLALQILREAQRQKLLTAYVDQHHTFDAEHAAHVGLHLAQLLLVRPQTPDEARQIIHAVVTTRAIDVIVLDYLPVAQARDTQRTADALAHLLPALAGAAITLLVLHPVALHRAARDGDALAHSAAVRLLLEHERWHARHDDVWGYDARVHVLKHPRGGSPAPIPITFTVPPV